MLIRTSLDQLSLLIRVAEEEAEEGDRRRHCGEKKENILKPFLFRSSIILAVLYLAASSTRKKIVLELFLLEFWSFWYVAYNQNMVFRMSLFL